MEIYVDILSSTVLFAMPLLIVALGGMYSERSGVVNLALEGIMIFGSMCGCLFLYLINKNGLGQTNSQLYVFFAILIAGFSGIIYSFLLSFAAIKLKANQTIGGTALNTLSPALAIMIPWAIQGQGNSTVYLPTWVRITQNTLGITTDGTQSLFERFVFKSFYLTTPIILLLFIISYIVLYKTRLGLRLRACGEHPQAADSVGINVFKMRYTGVAISGFFAGIGGLAFTFAAGSGFSNTVAGYGFLALAVMIFGNWKPLNIFGASLFFALFKVVSAYSSSIPFLPTFSSIKNPGYIYQMVPYIVTMIVLVFTSKKSQAPKAEGIPYDKSSR